MTGKRTKNPVGRPKILALLGLIALAAVVITLIFWLNGRSQRDRAGVADIDTVTTLEGIIDVSELSTFTAVYNGVAQVYNEEKPDQLDYYVSYEARVNAGIDFDRVSITLDQENKVVRVTLPEADILDTNVDIASLDFIFTNKKANTSTVTQQAYKACKEDVERESNRQGAILELARENARKVIRALTAPYLDSFYQDYELEVD